MPRKRRTFRAEYEDETAQAVVPKRCPWGPGPESGRSVSPEMHSEVGSHRSEVASRCSQGGS